MESSTHVVFYNIWGHRLPELLTDYFSGNTPEVDIFCLTEVTHMGKSYNPAPRVHTSTDLGEPPSSINGLEQIEKLLGSDYHISYKAAKLEPWKCEITQSVYDSVGFGSALVYRKDLKVVEVGESAIQFNTKRASDRLMQWIVYEKSGSRYLVAHLHGVWLRENTKGDDPVRDSQSEQVVTLLVGLVNEYRVDKVVFGGDLNLAIDTRALLTLEYDAAGNQRLINLVRERNVQNTRTPRYRKFHIVGEPKHADYAFVSPNVEVGDFIVRNEVEASDHAPLHLIFK